MHRCSRCALFEIELFACLFVCRSPVWIPDKNRTDVVPGADVSLLGFSGSCDQMQTNFQVTIDKMFYITDTIYHSALLLAF